MILDSKFEQLVRQNFLRSSREYDLARYFWANSERAMQQKPTQQPTLTTKNLTDKERTYVTDELAKYFAGFAWTIPKWVKDREQNEKEIQAIYTEYLMQHNFSRAELQSMQAHNKDSIKFVQEEIDWCYYQLKRYNEIWQNLNDSEEIAKFKQENTGFPSYHRNKISSSKLKLKKLVALQTKIKRLLAV